ncbi:MAG: GTP-binding protein [Planctomycetota bacterium]
MVDSSPRVYLLTPQAPAGIAVLSLQGIGSDVLIKSLFQPSRKLKRGLPGPDRAAHGYLVRKGEPLDEVLLVCIRDRPPQYEICCHGGSEAADAIIKALVDSGAEVAPWSRLVAPGTLEHDLFNALLRSQGSEQAVRLAGLYHGSLRSAFTAVKDALESCARGVTSGAGTAISIAEDLESSFACGRFLYRPPRVVICGPANAGKSTLFNAILGEQRALTSKIPGTTRDTVESLFLLQGFPVRLFDLPGKQPEQVDGLGALARKQAEKFLMDADLCLRLEAMCPEDSWKAQIPDRIEDSSARSGELRVLNKTDLLDPLQVKELEIFVQGNREDCLLVSARNGTGLGRLLERMDALIGLKTLRKNFRALLFNKKQLTMIRRAKKALRSSQADPKLLSKMENYLSAFERP